MRVTYGSLVFDVGVCGERGFDEGGRGDSIGFANGVGNTFESVFRTVVDVVGCRDIRGIGVGDDDRIRRALVGCGADLSAVKNSSGGGGLQFGRVVGLCVDPVEPGGGFDGGQSGSFDEIDCRKSARKVSEFESGQCSFGSGTRSVDAERSDCVRPQGSDRGGQNETKTERNRRWRRERGDRKRGRQLSGVKRNWRGGGSGLCSEACDSESAGLDDLRRSVEEKWIMKNRLEKMKAERECELMKASDIAVEVKRRALRSKADTERAMVAIERSHAKLINADCVPRDELKENGAVMMSDDGVVLGRVQTVVSSGISPNSSVSEAEVRAMQKENADLKKTFDDLMVKLKKIGVPIEHIEHLAKSEWTCDAIGVPTKENLEIIHDIFPRGFTAAPEDATLHLSGKLTSRIYGF